MGEQLRFIDGMQCFLALDFDNNSSFNHEISPKSAIQFDLLIKQRNWLLPLNFLSESL